MISESLRGCFGAECALYSHLPLKVMEFGCVIVDL